MNLIDDPWLPFRDRGGAVSYRPVSAICDPEIVDLALPRADFQGAAFQFLIALLQTAFSPEDLDEWMDVYEAPPSPERFKSQLERFRQAFVLIGDGPLFMQDYDELESETPAPASSLLIDAPGASTIKNNTDHFVKAGRAETFCPDCAAIALFTMQINAPSGGKGYRTGLRGGGPLTTLVLPPDGDVPLWQKLWLNTLDRDTNSFPDPDPLSHELFPWMGPTRVSEKGEKTLPTDVHPLHVYWAMPRRFRLIVEDQSCQCELCGRHSQQSISAVRARNYGNNYDGPWRHYLTPYRRDPKKPNEPPLSIKGQPGGIGYRHWETLVLEDAEGSGNLPAPVVLDYTRKTDELRSEGKTLPRKARLWAFGYDMDNMKPRAWYETQMPLVSLPPRQEEKLIDWVRDCVSLAKDAAWNVRTQVKGALFSNPKEVKGDMEYVESRFWERTEQQFFSILQELGDALLEDSSARFIPQAQAARWYSHVRLQAVEVFDELALGGPVEALDMKRITRSRNRLMYQLNQGKTAKNFRKQAGLEKVLPVEEEMEQAADQ